jgi:hypothetical protein
MRQIHWTEIHTLLRKERNTSRYWVDGNVFELHVQFHDTSSRRVYKKKVANIDVPRNWAPRVLIITQHNFHDEILRIFELEFDSKIHKKINEVCRFVRMVY